ncbi:biopolymer transport protein ExbD [Tenacibaculum skagerrakense]|uniref:Biopolymer transport protein ExbD n=1 Tax=Tenacibaculum skagerrakense TaxID=186571 RepID=A0A4R2P3I2_9FLAO|nr:biopolymer transporter ExbD [Tenacibaculum skagerrakense]TCP28461.1 biopolymer transport protein ExbD [Tenacibaculum skagerrakense]
MKRKPISEINAGSMADIAFLLLIFFLVTTTLDVDQGIFSRIAQENPNPLDTHKRNVFDISINRNNEILVGDTEITVDELSQLAQDFIDNGAGKDATGNSCDWCKGKKLSTSSDHPTKAIITIEADREASYETYVSVLDKVHLAYNTLRNRLSMQLYNKSFTALETAYKKTHSNSTFEKIELIKSKYPLLIGNIELESTMAKK